MSCYRWENGFEISFEDFKLNKIIEIESKQIPSATNLALNVQMLTIEVEFIIRFEACGFLHEFGF